VDKWEVLLEEWREVTKSLAVYFAINVLGSLVKVTLREVTKSVDWTIIYVALLRSWL